MDYEAHGHSDYTNYDLQNIKHLQDEFAQSGQAFLNREAKLTVGNIDKDLHYQNFEANQQLNQSPSLDTLEIESESTCDVGNVTKIRQQHLLTSPFDAYVDHGFDTSTSASQSLVAGPSDVDLGDEQTRTIQADGVAIELDYLDFSWHEELNIGGVIRSELAPPPPLVPQSPFNFNNFVPMQSPATPRNVVTVTKPKKNRKRPVAIRRLRKNDYCELKELFNNHVMPERCVVKGQVVFKWKCPLNRNEQVCNSLHTTKCKVRDKFDVDKAHKDFIKHHQRFHRIYSCTIGQQSFVGSVAFKLHKKDCATCKSVESVVDDVDVDDDLTDDLDALLAFDFSELLV